MSAPHRSGPFRPTHDAAGMWSAPHPHQYRKVQTRRSSSDRQAESEWTIFTPNLVCRTLQKVCPFGPNSFVNAGNFVGRTTSNQARIYRPEVITRIRHDKPINIQGALDPGFFWSACFPSADRRRSSLRPEEDRRGMSVKEVTALTSELLGPPSLA